MGWNLVSMPFVVNDKGDKVMDKMVNGRTNIDFCRIL